MHASIDFVGLKKCIDKMASLMACAALPDERAQALIEFVAYGPTDKHPNAKDSLRALAEGLITEREYRNLFMTHCVDSISSYSGCNAKGLDEFITKELCESFEMALLGRTAVLCGSDVRDSWEE